MSEDKITADKHYTLYLYRSIASVVAMENLSINIGLRENLTNVVTLLSLKSEFTHQTSEDTSSCSSTSPGGPHSQIYLCSKMCYLQQSLCLLSGLFGDRCRDSRVKRCVTNQRPILSRREHHILLLSLGGRLRAWNLCKACLFTILLHMCTLYWGFPHLYFKLLLYIYFACNVCAHVHM